MQDQTAFRNCPTEKKKKLVERLYKRKTPTKNAKSNRFAKRSCRKDHISENINKIKKKKKKNKKNNKRNKKDISLMLLHDPFKKSTSYRLKALVLTIFSKRK